MIVHTIQDKNVAGIEAAVAGETVTVRVNADAVPAFLRSQMTQAAISAAVVADANRRAVLHGVR